MSVDRQLPFDLDTPCAVMSRCSFDAKMYRSVRREARREKNDNDLKSVRAALRPFLFFITFSLHFDDILSLRFISCTSSLIGESLTLI